MDGLICQIDGKNYTLKADATVFDDSRANVGTWKNLQNTPAANGIVVSLTSGDRTIPVRYAFNSSNQLLVSFQNSNGTSTPQQVLNGRLVLPDHQNIGYQLVDDQGNDLAGMLTVYGSLRLDANNDITITFADGSLTVIDADQIGHDANNTGAAGSDVIIVTATTFDYDGALIQLADISLPGSFKPVGNKLVFELNGQTGVNLTFDGTFKGTSIGIEYHQGNGSGSTLVFSASGSYRWNGGSANFTVFLGNSTNGFSANVAFNANLQPPGNKGRLQLSGNLDFGPSGAGGTTMDLNLEVQQQWDANKSVTFNIVDQNGQISYDLGVEGTATIAGGKLTFALKYSSTGTLNLNLGYTGEGLTAAVNVTFNQNFTDINAGINLSVQVSWQNGNRVTTPVHSSAAASLLNG